MMLVPIGRRGTNTYRLVVILEEGNVERMRSNDPAAINVSLLPLEYQRKQLTEIYLFYPTLDDMKKFMTMMGDGHLRAALSLIERGYVVKPEDSDRPYETGH